jgi:hypothetical protein
LEDRWIVSRVLATAQETNKLLSEFRSMRPGACSTSLSGATTATGTWRWPRCGCGGRRSRCRCWRMSCSRPAAAAR